MCVGQIHSQCHVGVAWLACDNLCGRHCAVAGLHHDKERSVRIRGGSNESLIHDQI